MDLATKKQELAELRQRVETLESEILSEEAKGKSWEASGFYGSYYAMSGLILGIIGAIVSLLVNVIAAPIAGKNPLELIRVYLTFPLGEKALQLTTGADDGMIIAIGCCLYIGTGMLLGMFIHVGLKRFVPNAGLGVRIIVASIFATLLWLVNFYGLLAWLQPALFGGNWITDNAVLPWWVAFATHLVFGWTMAVVYPWGQYRPYVRPATA
ncbi:MAG: hypothetical protein AB8G99_16235 [Planctomycetaceae bacterium]